MPLVMVTEDAAFRCTKCGHIIKVKKGQLLPPCTRCGGPMEKVEGPLPETPEPGCR